MDSPEQIPDQDQKLANLVDQAVERLRQEFLARLEETRSQVERQLRAESAVAAPAPRRDTASLESLHGAISSVDRSRSQNEILTALLKGGVRFASRSVLLLTGQSGLGGWGASGFGASAEKVGSLELPYGTDTAWSRLAAGRGAIELSAADCAQLCDHIDGSRPAGGILIPLILRDRIAACLYADRLADDEILDPMALQLLTYVSGQAIETLALRERRSTATLRLAAEAPAEEAGLPLWQAEAAVPDVEVEVEPSEPAAAPQPLPEEEIEVEEAAPPPAAGAAEAVEIEEPPAYEPSEAPVVEETYQEPIESVQDTGFAVEPAVDIEPPMAEEVAGQTQQLRAEPDMEPAPPSVEMPTTDATPDSLPAEETPQRADELYAEPEPTPPPEPPAAPAQPAPSSAQVAPPDDLQGPGWAFTTTIPSPTESGDQSEHEEARRLARLLVTEIKLYNEEQVEEGRRKGNIYRELKEDIDRSRQIFEERIDEQIRSEADYFQEELVRILAGGDAEALGA